MKTRIHAIAGAIGFLTILTFWTSTVYSEVFGTHETIIAVKNAIVWGLLILVPSMAIVGGSGMSLGKKRRGKLIEAKKKKMPIIALNGILVLIPCALFLASKANAADFDTIFYTVQGLELAAGALNLALMGVNIRSGLVMTGRIGR